jgi:hypothetical protein
MPLTVQISAYSLATEDEAKTWASINHENVPEGDILRLLLNTASINVEKAIQFEVVSRGLITEQHTIRNEHISKVFLLQPNILGVDEVNDDPNRVFGSTTIIDGSELIFDTEIGAIQRVGAGGSLPVFYTLGIDSLQVKYWSGVAATANVDWDIKGLACEAVAEYFYHLQRKQFATRQITDDQGNRTFMKFDFLPDSIKAKTKELKRITIGKITGRRVSADAGTPYTPP